MERDDQLTAIPGMLGVVSKYWWVMLLRGLLAIAFGVMAIVWPGLTLFWMIWLFGVYAIVDGVLEIWSGIRNRYRHDRWWTEILIGLAGIVAGFLVLVLPGVTAIVLIYFIAAWMIFSGVMGIIYAIRVRNEISNEWFIIISGVLSVIVGLYFLAFPRDGALSLVWLIGIYAILFGIMLVAFAMRARRGFGPPAA
jgi:uncharacterized membrane protein HdeD (DUF308 family)